MVLNAMSRQESETSSDKSSGLSAKIDNHTLTNTSVSKYLETHAQVAAARPSVAA